MSERRSSLAAAGEAQAAALLERLGYRILARRYRCRWGELDLVAQDQDALVFVEVKARTAVRYGSPAEAVTARKRECLARAAACFLADHPRWRDYPARFDVVEATWSRGRWQLRHLRDAFRVWPTGEPRGAPRAWGAHPPEERRQLTVSPGVG